MPPLMRKSWESDFIGKVKGISRGFIIREESRRLRLEYRSSDGKRSSKSLGYEWAALEDTATRAAVEKEIALIYEYIKQNDSFQQAVHKASNRLQTNASVNDWNKALERFKDFKLNFENTIDERTTWEAGYVPVLTTAVKILSSDEPPSETHDLFEASLRRWKPGSRSRQSASQRLAQYLRFCVERMNFPISWTPPKDLSQFIGVVNRNKADAPPSIKGCPIEDEEILRIIDAIENKAINAINSRDRDSAAKWNNAFKLMILYGLRPIELLHLRVAKDEISGEPTLWCDYEKRGGAGKTKPRRLLQLPLCRDGEQVRWNVFDLLRAGLLELPPLTAKDGPSGAARKYLRKNSTWLSLEAELAARKENLVVYTFRHSYSLRGHKLGIDGGSMALAMGHSYRTHCDEYPWASQSNMVAAFDSALKRAYKTGVAT